MPLWNLLNPWRGHNDRVARTMDEVLARAEQAGPCCARRRLDLKCKMTANSRIYATMKCSGRWSYVQT
jgi:hypothetical protein